MEKKLDKIDLKLMALLQENGTWETEAELFAVRR